MTKTVKLVREVWWFLGESRKRLLFFSILATVCSITGLIPPWFLGAIIELVASKQPSHQIAIYCASMAVLLIVLHSTRVWAKREAAVIQARITARVREQALDQLLNQGLREGRLVGNEISRLESGLRDFAELYRIIQNEILFSSVNFIACCVLFITLDCALLFLTLVYVAVVVSILRVVVPKITEVQADVSRARESFSGLFTNVVGMASSVRAQGAEDIMSAKVGDSARRVEHFEQKRVKLAAVQWRAFNILNACFYAAILYRLGTQGLSGEMAISMIVVSFGYLREFISAALRMFEIAETLVQSAVGFSRMLHLLADRDEIFTRSLEVPTDWRQIEFANVSHSYSVTDSDESSVVNVIRGLTFTISRGETLSIVGPSGAGKSTLVKILLGLLTPASGEVRLDNVALSKYTLESIRREMAIALQECEILAFSLRENITMFREVSAEMVAEVVNICGLSAVIERLPNGLDTLLGESGYRLSGGERQRVALARALIRRPSLLVVDEATSMLDSETEANFFAGVKKLLPTLTMVIISHHERTQDYAQKTYTLTRGQLVVAE